MSEDFLWVEKYRPKMVEDTILPPNLKSTFSELVKTQEVPNMLFCGTSGLGKTTVARAICNSLDCDYIIINGSEEGNIDTLRGKITRFASTASWKEGAKVVIIDEADYLNPQSTQPALRRFIEQYSKNCRFIFTCNFKNKIIEPLHSRCGVYEFNTTKKQMQKLCADFYARCLEILEKENIEVENKDVIAQLIMKYAPDWRRVLNELQKHSVSGVITADVLMSSSDANYQQLFNSLKNKEFKKMRSWVANNIDVDTTSVFRQIYDKMYETVEPDSIPRLVLILADYQYKNAFVADHELNMVACFTEIMANVEFV